MLRHLETAPAERASRPRRALVLVNPGAWRGSEGVKPALERLRAAGIETLAETFSGPTEISRDILRRAGEVDAVVVCGCAGTVSRAAPRSSKRGCPSASCPSAPLMTWPGRWACPSIGTRRPTSSRQAGSSRSTWAS